MSSSEKHLYEFGEFRLDTAERLLLRNGIPVQLPPKAFDMLVVLVQNGGHLLDKERLMRELWPDAFVEEVNLSVNISVLRKALGGSEAGEGFIATVPKRGYRFTAQVRELEGGDEDLIVHNRLRARIVTEEVESAGEVASGTGALESKGAIGAAPPSIRERFLDNLKRRKGATGLALAALLLAITGGGYGLSKLIGHKAVATFERMKIARLTNNGKAVGGVISPDGKYVVYVMADSGQQSLWLRQVAAARNVQIVSPSDVRYGGMTFSSDGNFIYYVSESEIDELYQVPVLGGVPRKLIVDIDSPITLSPDGKRLAFMRGYASEGQSAVMVANVDGTSEQKLAVRKSPDFFSGANSAPAWSPDGKVIACPVGTTGVEGSYMMVLQVRVQDGLATPMTSQRWWRVGRMAWFPDGKGLILSGQEQESSPSQIWYLSYPDGEVHRITNDLNDYYGVSLTADGAELVTVQSGLLSSIWIAPSWDTAHAKTIRSSNADGLEGLSWTPDGHIVYASRVSGHSDIWIMAQDGSDQKQLTADGSNNKWPATSADGRYIVFTSDRAGLQNVWRMDIDGNNLRQLTKGGGEGLPDCSPDGHWVVYRSILGKKSLFKVSIDGGEPMQLNKRASSRPAISPDGKWIASAYFDDPAGLKTAIYPFTGGDPVKILPLSFLNFYMRWTPDSRALAYIDRQNQRNIESQPVDGGPATQLTDFQSDHIVRFAWSRDGKQLALTRGSVTNDVVLLNSLR